MKLQWEAVEMLNFHKSMFCLFCNQAYQVGFPCLAQDPPKNERRAGSESRTYMHARHHAKRMPVRPIVKECVYRGQGEQAELWSSREMCKVEWQFLCLACNTKLVGCSLGMQR